MTVPAVPRAILLLLVAGLLPLVGVALFRKFGDVPLADMLRDVTALADLHPLAGAMSTLGILGWWSSVTLWCFCAWLQGATREGDSFRFPLYSGLLSAWLALDDQFQLHEELAPDYLHITEQVALAALAAATAGYLWRFRRTILGSPGRWLLLWSLGLLGGSLLVDTILIEWMWPLRDWKMLVEDGLKWLGIVFWLGFCAVHCRAILLESRRRACAR